MGFASQRTVLIGAILYCPSGATGKCRPRFVNSSPRSADNEAARINRYVNRCPPKAMKEHAFTIQFLAPGRTLDDLSVHLYERIDEASLEGPHEDGSDTDGSFLYEFDRQASSLPDALAMALNELTSALPEATVLRVHEYDLLSMSDIAARSGRSAESVRLLVHGKRGPGGFPPAAGNLGGRMKVWRLAEVAEWFDKALGEPLPDTEDSMFLQALNDALDIRRLSAKLGEPQRRAVASALPANLAA